MINLGIDFGSSYTKIAYPDENSHPRLFYYPNQQSGRPYISTEIAYINRKGRDSRFIGSLAFEHINDSNKVDFYRDFKRDLPLPTLDPDKQIWKNGHTPVSVTHDFFEELLMNGRYSLKQNLEKIDWILIAVPEIWYRDPANIGPERLLEIFENLGIPRERLQLQSEPVCAAAYYIHRNRQSLEDKKDYNLLVCDLGGSTFEVALCKVVENKYIRVLKRDGSVERGASAAFDRACVEAACLTRAHKTPDNPTDFYGLQRTFEERKINPDLKIDLPNLISEENAKDPHLFDVPVYTFDGYEVTTSQVWQAFLPIQDEIRNVISRVLEVCRQNNWKIDQAILIGGFGQYHLAQKAVFGSLPEINAEENSSLLPEGERYCAIAKGAYYIINGDIHVDEPYQHTVGIIVNGLVDGYLCEMKIPIIQANRVLAGMATSQFATNEKGEKIIFHVDRQQAKPLPIYVQQNGHEPSRKIKLAVGQIWPQPGEYSVRYQVDRFNRVTLIFERTDQTTQYVYLLEELNLE